MPLPPATVEVRNANEQCISDNVVEKYSTDKKNLSDAAEPLCPVSPGAVGVVLHSTSAGSTEKVD